MSTPEDYQTLLGRVKQHDERSRGFAMGVTIDRSTWKDKAIRIYDPSPNPNQRIGCCTMVSKCSQLNSIGNRVTGRVLNMADAERGYARNTELDPFPGTYPPDDTGSSGLASAKTAVEFGWARPEYNWLFGGANEVVQNVVEGRVISVGTAWMWDMFSPDANNYIRATGGVAGGHQYVARAYDATRDWVGLRCWWGSFRDVWISRADLDILLQDGGDAHFQRSV